MIPTVQSVASVEMLRDGGSYAAEFLDGRGVTHWLFFRVRLAGTGAEAWKITGYDAPVVFERRERRTAVKCEWFSENEVELSWEQARELLRAVGAHLRDAPGGDKPSVVAWHRRWFAAMQAVAAADGKVA